MSHNTAAGRVTGAQRRGTVAPGADRSGRAAQQALVHAPIKRITVEDLRRAYGIPANGEAVRA